MNRRAEEERTRQQEERRRQEIMMRQQEMQRRSGGGHMDSGMPPRSREEMMVCDWDIFVNQYSFVMQVNLHNLPWYNRTGWLGVKHHVTC